MDDSVVAFLESCFAAFHNITNFGANSLFPKAARSLQANLPAAESQGVNEFGVSVDDDVRVVRHQYELP